MHARGRGTLRAASLRGVPAGDAAGSTSKHDEATSRDEKVTWDSAG